MIKIIKRWMRNNTLTKRREKVERLIDEMEQRIHALDRQEDEIASERLYIKRQLERRRKQRDAMEPLASKIIVNTMNADSKEWERVQHLFPGRSSPPPKGEGELGALAAMRMAPRTKGGV